MSPEADTPPPAVRIVEADPAGPDARYAAERYYAELGSRLRDGFDPRGGGAIADAAITAPAGVLLLAYVGDRRAVGCGAVTFQDGGFAEIKRVWADPATRGAGLGRRLMAELEARAAQAGCHTVRLDTNGGLTEAIAMYRKLGYVETQPYNANPYAHHWFAKPLQLRR